MLIGHSYGGVLIRGFAAAFRNEVTGLAYIEVPNFDSTRVERANVLPEQNRARALEAPELPPVPPDAPAGLRAEIEVIADGIVNDFPEARLMPQPPGIPVAVIIAAPPGRLTSPGDALLRLQLKHQSEWALLSLNGLIIVSGRVGHGVPQDDPELVVQAAKHALAMQR